MIFIIILSDEDLQKIQQRDPLVFNKIYKEFKDKVWTFLIIKTNGNEEITEEIFCDTFHSAIESAPNLKNTKNIQAWLLQIASRRLNDFFRKKYREKKYIEDIEDKEISINDPIHEDIESKQEIMLINMAMNKLKDNHKEILKLKYIEKKSQKEISSMLNITSDAVNSLLSRARLSLKKEFEKIVNKNKI